MRWVVSHPPEKVTVTNSAPEKVTVTNSRQIIDCSWRAGKAGPPVRYSRDGHPHATGRSAET
jgi:hypothetical protein